jgi:ABC-type multidrug transport system fused ATPase/permease subunit
VYFLWRGTIASKVLYNNVLKTLLAAPVRFYDQTPNGRIMNRLSKDMETIDQDVPAGLLFFTLELFATASVIVAVAIALPLLLLGGLVVSIAYTLLGWLYISTSRELKRIGEFAR